MTITTMVNEPTLQSKFEALLPRIIDCLRKACWRLRCAESRADFIAEGVGLCWKWFCRAVAKGKDVASFVTAMAKLAARAVQYGRTVCGQQKAKDVMSLTAKRKHGVVVERFGSGQIHFQTASSGVGHQHKEILFEDALAENTVTSIPQQVMFRVDWPRFVEKQSHRDQQLMEFLAAGNSNQDAATKFGLTPGRVSQLRRSWCEAWQEFSEG
jgi:hypothetical protein